MKDTPSRTSAKPSGARGQTRLSASDEGALRVVVLGANLWAVTVLWPLLGSRETGLLELLLGLAAPLPLVLGAALRSAARPSWLAAALWLFVFPVVLGSTLALRPEAVNQQLYGPFALGLAWLSLCAYGASAAAATRSRGTELAATQVALGDEPWDAPPPRSSAVRTAFIVSSLAGAAALCLVAPRTSGTQGLERAWGEAAMSGGTLTAIAGAALAVTVVALYLGEGLRGGNAPQPHGDQGVRIAWYLFLTLLGSVTYFITQP
ncbi:MAG: hypothetical protein ACHQ53_12995 [Polyangiales bacterium]